MKILKAIAIVAPIYCCQSFTMEKNDRPRVQYKSIIQHVTSWERWIQPGKDTITCLEWILAQREVIREGYAKRPYNQEEACEKARTLAQEEEHEHVPPEMRQQREQQLRQYYIQQQEQEIMKSEQDWN